MKKIAFLMATPFTYGGEQRVVTKIANLFYEQGFEVSIICTVKTKRNNEIYGLNKNIKIEDASPNNVFSKFIQKVNYKIRQFNSYTRILSNFPEIIRQLIFTPLMRKKIINTINKNQYDYVVGVASEFSVFLATYKKKFNKNTKIIGWQHTTFEACFLKKGRRQYGEHKLFKKYANQFDYYVTLMEDDKKEIVKSFNVNCTKIFNPLSFENVKKISKLENEQFIWFGRFNRMKGIDMLVEAYEMYKKMGGTWKLQIIGDGEAKNEIKELVTRKQLTKDIDFIDFTTNIGKYLEKASIFLFPSRWEGFGLTLTESMQYGIPAICYDLNAFIEITEGFESCYLIPQFDVKKFAEKMFELSNDKEQIKKMSKAALKNIKKFEGNTIINEWIKMINN